MLEAIEWLDHWAGSGWKDHDKFLAPKSRCCSIGWVLDENKDVVILAATVGDGAQNLQRMCILKSTIQKRWKIKDLSPVTKAFKSPTLKKGTISSKT